MSWTSISLLFFLRVSGGGSAVTGACRGTSHCRESSPVQASPLFWRAASREGERRSRKGEAWQRDREWCGWPVSFCFIVIFMSNAASLNKHMRHTLHIYLYHYPYLKMVISDSAFTVIFCVVLCTHTHSKGVWYFLYPRANLGRRAQCQNKADGNKSIPSLGSITIWKAVARLSAIEMDELSAESADVFHGKWTTCALCLHLIDLQL